MCASPSRYRVNAAQPAGDNDTRVVGLLAVAGFAQADQGGVSQRPQMGRQIAVGEPQAVAQFDERQRFVGGQQRHNRQTGPGVIAGSNFSNASRSAASFIGLSLVDLSLINVLPHQVFIRLIGAGHTFDLHPERAGARFASLGNEHGGSETDVGRSEADGHGQYWVGVGSQQTNGTEREAGSTEPGNRVRGKEAGGQHTAAIQREPESGSKSARPTRQINTVTINAALNARQHGQQTVRAWRDQTGSPR